MDKNNVIVPTDDIEELKLDYNKWDSTLTYDQKKRSNMKCEELYGCNNMELFDKLNSAITTANDVITKESFDIPDNFLANWDILNKIKMSQIVMDQHQDLILLIDYPKPMPIDQLEFLYNKFQSSITHDRRLMSDRYSLEIWGASVTDMYKKIKGKIMSLSNKVDNPITLKEGAVDVTITHFLESYSEADELRREIMKIDGYTEKDTFYETVLLREGIEKCKIEKFNYNSVFDNVAPWFTPNEYTDIVEEDVDPFAYAFIENGTEYYDTIKELQEEHNIPAQLKLGWNPAIKMNPSALKVARRRQVDWFNENERRVQIIDVSNLSTNLPKTILEADEDNELKDTNIILKPIYIVLSLGKKLHSKIIAGFTKAEFSHSGISLDSSMNNIYTFTDKGFTKESIKDSEDVNLMVNTIFVPEKIYDKVKSNIKNYENNKEKYSYGWSNLLDYVTKKSKDISQSLNLVCSQFVDNVLKLSNIDITHKSTNLVAPGDFSFKPDEKVKVFTIYKGNSSMYNRREADKKVKGLLKSSTIQQLNVMESFEVLNLVSKCYIENFFMCDSENEYIHESLKNIRKMLTPTDAFVIREFKVPVRFTDLGDLNIDLPKNLQSEYEEAHRLLSMYDITNLNGMKHEVARLFFLNGIIEKKLKKIKKDKGEFKTYMDLRARILNDYSTYFKVIKKADPDFDFMEYLKGTEYWNKSLMIDGSTLKYSGSYIKKALQLLK